MSLMEIIYTVLYGAGILAAFVLVLFIISNIFRKHPDINVSEENNNIKTNPYSKFVRKVSGTNLADAYRYTIQKYPLFISFIITRQRNPISYDRCLIFYSRRLSR